jgi:hypothetical protein
MTGELSAVPFELTDVAKAFNLVRLEVSDVSCQLSDVILRLLHVALQDSDVTEGSTGMSNGL